MFEEQWLLEEAMTEIGELLGSGKITAAPVTPYALDRVADAHRDIESGNTAGKLILVP